MLKDKVNSKYINKLLDSNVSKEIERVKELVTLDNYN